MVRGKHDSAVRKIAEFAEETWSNMKPELVRHRLAVATNLVLFTIGEREKLRMAGRRSRVARLGTEDFIQDLIQMLIGALSAPVTTGFEHSSICRGRGSPKARRRSLRPVFRMRSNTAETGSRPRRGQ